MYLEREARAGSGRHKSHSSPPSPSTAPAAAVSAVDTGVQLLNGPGISCGDPLWYPGGSAGMRALWVGCLAEAMWCRESLRSKPTCITGHLCDLRSHSFLTYPPFPCLACEDTKTCFACLKDVVIRDNKHLLSADLG
jgi:hypothetical protein